MACGMATSRACTQCHFTTCYSCCEKHDCTEWKNDDTASSITSATPTCTFGPEPNYNPQTLEYQQYRDVYNEHYFKELTASGVLGTEWLLFDTGAAAHCCPENYAEDYPLLPVGANPPTLRTVTRQNINIIGRRLVGYDFGGSIVSSTTM